MRTAARPAPVISALILVLLLLWGCKKEEEPVIPPPSQGSESYSWIGDYRDETGGKAILSIEKSQLYGKDYYITVYVPGGEAAFSLWECDGNYDESLGAIVYDGCVRTDVDTGIISDDKKVREGDRGEGAGDTKDSPVARVYREDDDDEEVKASRLAYTDGTGMIFVSDDVLFWIDDKDKRGQELRFKRMEDEGGQ